MYDANVVDKFIGIEKKILKSFIKLCCYRKNFDLFNREMSFLSNVLLKKEDILISKLPVSDVILYNILDNIIDNKSNFFDNECVGYFVLQRIKSIVDGLIMVFDDEYKDVDCHKEKCYINNNLSVQLLYSISQDDGELGEMLEIAKYYEVYTSKSLSDKLVDFGFDFKNLKYLKDSELSMRLDVDNNDYYLIKNDGIYDSLKDLTYDLLDVFSDGDESYILSYMLFKFKFLIHTISDDKLSLFNKFFCNMVNSVSDDQFIHGFMFTLTYELNRRGLNKEKNEYCKPIFEPNLSYIIDLIKLEGKIYELFNLIDFDCVSEDILSCLRNYISMEGYLVSNIKIDDSNESILKSMFESDLSFFLAFEDDVLSLISRRIFNVVPYFNKKNVSPTQSFLSYDYINKNHIVRSLKKFVFVLADGDDKYLKFFKDIIFVNDFLTYDFLITGNYMMFEDVSDSLVCDILDIKPIEYSFDKSEQLLTLADEIISDVSIYDGDDEAYVFFKLAELEDIVDNLSEEYLFELKENVIPSGFYDKKIIKKVEKFLKR